MPGTLGPGIGYGRAARFMYIATAGQTTFTGADSSAQALTMGYTPGFLEVSVNGLWLPPTDYTATNGSSIVLPTATVAGDIVYAYALSVVSVVNTYDKTQNGADISDKQAFKANLVVGAPDVIVEDQEASSANAGTATSGAWFTRVLNTYVRNILGLAAISSNSVTLPAGTYYARWSAPNAQCDLHQTRLYNVTDAAQIGVGVPMYGQSSGGFVMSESVGAAIFTIATAKAIRIEHRVQTSSANVGALGAGVTWGGSVFARLEITRLA